MFIFSPHNVDVMVSKKGLLTRIDNWKETRRQPQLQCGCFNSHHLRSGVRIWSRQVGHMPFNYWSHLKKVNLVIPYDTIKSRNSIRKCQLYQEKSRPSHIVVFLFLIFFSFCNCEILSLMYNTLWTWYRTLPFAFNSKIPILSGWDKGKTRDISCVAFLFQD